LAETAGSQSVTMAFEALRANLGEAVRLAEEGHEVVLVDGRSGRVRCRLVGPDPLLAMA
jgi:hypothetical protein